MKTLKLKQSGNTNRETQQKNEALQRAFAPLALKFNLLFEDAKVQVKMTDEELIKLLLEGEGIYWDLIKTQTNIQRVIPYSDAKIVENLQRKKRLENIGDVFFDFHERQREWFD